MIKKELDRRKLPDIFVHTDGQKVTADSWPKRRAELLELFRENEYGFSPPAPENLKSDVIVRDINIFARKAIMERINISFNTPRGKFSFPFTLIIPKAQKAAKTFLLLNFYSEIPNVYCPTEELIDNGYAVAQLFYEDVTPDNAKHAKPLKNMDDYFIDNFSKCYPRNPKTGWGKVGMWAWAASRVMDVLCTRPEIDSEHVALVGHSRLGKTALWCSAQDERFVLTVSNDSGSCGAALAREKSGENIACITDLTPYWFCGNLAKYAGKEHEMPIDQHMLLALIAPRALIVNSAEIDTCADPMSEYLSVCAASPAFELLGKDGLDAPNREVLPGEYLLNGTIAYCRRKGIHYLSRTDWLNIMEYREMHNI